MATYNFTTNQTQDDALAWKLGQINAERTESGLSTISLPALIQGAVKEKLLDPLVDAYKQEEGTRIKDALRLATPAQWAQIKALLGL